MVLTGAVDIGFNIRRGQFSQSCPSLFPGNKHQQASTDPIEHRIRTHCASGQASRHKTCPCLLTALDSGGQHSKFSGYLSRVPQDCLWDSTDSLSLCGTY